MAYGRKPSTFVPKYPTVHGAQRSQHHRFARLKPRKQRKTICHAVILTAADRQRDPYGADGWRHRPPTAEAVGYISTAAMRLTQ